MRNLFVALVVFLISCNSKSTIKDQQSEVKNLQNIDTTEVLIESEPFNQHLVNKLLNKAMSEGDSISYDDVYAYHISRNIQDKFLYYSLEMANRYHYPKANFDVYFILSSPYDGRALDELDVETRNMAIHYLLRAYEMGYESALDEVRIVYKNKVIPKSSDVW